MEDAARYSTTLGRRLFHARPHYGVERERIVGFALQIDEPSLSTRGKANHWDLTIQP